MEKKADQEEYPYDTCIGNHSGYHGIILCRFCCLAFLLLGDSELSNFCIDPFSFGVKGPLHRSHLVLGAFLLPD